MRKKERFVLGKRTFRSQKSKHFVLRIIDEGWAKFIIKETISLGHIETHNMITEAGYDIRNNCEQLLEIYNDLIYR